MSLRAWRFSWVSTMGVGYGSGCGWAQRESQIHGTSGGGAECGSSTLVCMAGGGARRRGGVGGFLVGPPWWGWFLRVGFSALIPAALWAQFIEGSPSLLRPYGYYGG